MSTRRFCLVALSACVSIFFVGSTARAQYKLETCEDLKITEAHYGINTVETATCINPEGIQSQGYSAQRQRRLFISESSDRRRRDFHRDEERRQRGVRARRRLLSFAESHDCLCALHHQRSGQVLLAAGEPLQQSTGLGRD